MSSAIQFSKPYVGLKWYLFNNGQVDFLVFQKFLYLHHAVLEINFIIFVYVTNIKLQSIIVLREVFFNIISKDESFV